MGSEVALPSESSKRANPWMIATIVLAAALVALGIWVVVDQQSRQSISLAPEEVTDMLEARIATMNEPDGRAAAEYYSIDGTLWELDQDPPEVSRGRTRIADRLESLCDDGGLRLKSAGASIMNARFVAEPVNLYFEGESGHGEGMCVFELDERGEIQNQWVMGWVILP